MEYIFPVFIGGLIGLFIGFTVAKGAYAFNFVYGAILYGVPLYFVMQSANGFPLVTLGFALTANATGYARELIEPFNVPSVLRNKFLMIITNVALLIDFVLMCYFVYRIFSDYSWMGIAHLVFAISIVTIVSRSSPYLLMAVFFKNAFTPIITTVLGLVIFIRLM